jgi:hypothetical protein
MILSLLAFATAVVSLLLRLHDTYEKWRTRRPTEPPVLAQHPLAAERRDIAAAIRERWKITETT